MDIYFNPYPGAAKSEEEGRNIAVRAADALFRLRKECRGVSLSGCVSGISGDLPSEFVLIRKDGVSSGISDILYKTQNAEREKLRLLLVMFSEGRVIGEENFHDTEDWIVSGIGTAAPVLEIAVKRNALALTISAEEEWRVDLLCFDNRDKKLHNIWGQDDISAITAHCIDSLTNVPERFTVRFKAKFCEGALHSAADFQLWEKNGYFQNMERAKSRDYAVDGNLIKSVGHTNHGTLLELRCYGAGQRIFFVYRRGSAPEVVIGGFYQKGIGKETTAQDKAILDATNRINSYRE